MFSSLVVSCSYQRPPEMRVPKPLVVAHQCADRDRVSSTLSAVIATARAQWISV
jgi:hypothetical protein